MTEAAHNQADLADPIDPSAAESAKHPGNASGLTCPECHGSGLYGSVTHLNRTYQQRARDTRDQAGVLRDLLDSLMHASDVG